MFTVYILLCLDERQDGPFPPQMKTVLYIILYYTHSDSRNQIPHSLDTVPLTIIDTLERLT